VIKPNSIEFDDESDEEPSLCDSEIFIGRAIQSVKKFDLANGRQLPKIIFMLAATLLKNNHLKKHNILR
jgi:hypothetical protein